VVEAILTIRVPVYRLVFHVRVPFGALFVVAAFTGLRMGELRALRWSDVDFGKPGPRAKELHRQLIWCAQVTVRPKRRNERSGRTRARRPQPPRPRHRARRPRLLACHNLPFHHDTARKRFYAALEAAGLGRLRAKDDAIVFHDLRHTFGTLAVQAFPRSDVKAMMGHAARRGRVVAREADSPRSAGPSDVKQCMPAAGTDHAHRARQWSTHTRALGRVLRCGASPPASVMTC
jgi:integrase